MSRGPVCFHLCRSLLNTPPYIEPMKKDDIFRFLFLYIYYIISILCNVFKSPHANVRVFVSYTVGRKRKSEQFSYTIPLIEKIPVLQWSAWRWWWWPPQRLWTKDRRNNKLWRRWPGRCSAGQRISARCRQGPATIYVQGSCLTVNTITVPSIKLV